MSSKIYITSDTHFYHQKMVTHFGRTKFKDVNEMNNVIVQNINKKVQIWDKLYHLGDVTYRKSEFQKNIEPHILVADIEYIKGNHDKKSISDVHLKQIIFQQKIIELVHNPNDHTGTCDIVIHGHIHKGGNRSMNFKGYYVKDYIYIANEGNNIFYNVNLEFHKYKPKHLTEILSEINQFKKLLKVNK